MPVLGETNAEINITSKFDDTGFKAASKSLGGFSNEFSSATKTWTGGLNNFTDGILNVGKKVALTLTGMGIAGATFAVKQAADLETARMGFVTLLGSADKADEILKQIKKDAAATPFELKGLIQANQLLTAVTKDGHKSEKLLLDVGKALAAMGRGQSELDRIIVNLQQIGAVGKASLIDIKQFAFAGIPIFEMLTQTTGLAGEALSEFISDGGVTFDLLTTMFHKAGNEGGRFADAFKNQGGTMNQVLSNFKDQLFIAGSEIAVESGLLENMKRILGEVVTWISNNREEIGEFAKKIVEFMENAGKQMIEMLKNLRDFWRENGDTIKLVLIPAIEALAALLISAKVIGAINGFVGVFQKGMAAAQLSAMATTGSLTGVGGLAPALMGLPTVITIAIAIAAYAAIKAQIEGLKKDLDDLDESSARLHETNRAALKKVAELRAQGKTKEAQYLMDVVKRNSGVGLAKGGSFIVPSGYPNDTYPLGNGIYAQSGERVTVTPANQKTTGGITNSRQVIINNPVFNSADSVKELFRQIDRDVNIAARGGTPLRGNA